MKATRKFQNHLLILTHILYILLILFYPTLIPDIFVVQFLKYEISGKQINNLIDYYWESHIYVKLSTNYVYIILIMMNADEISISFPTFEF
jgi:hypothetical protein